MTTEKETGATKARQGAGRDLLKVLVSILTEMREMLHAGPESDTMLLLENDSTNAGGKVEAAELSLGGGGNAKLFWLLEISYKSSAQSSHIIQQSRF